MPRSHTKIATAKQGMRASVVEQKPIKKKRQQAAQVERDRNTQTETFLEGQRTETHTRGRGRTIRSPAITSITITSPPPQRKGSKKKATKKKRKSQQGLTSTAAAVDYSVLPRTTTCRSRGQVLTSRSGNVAPSLQQEGTGTTTLNPTSIEDTVVGGKTKKKRIPPKKTKAKKQGANGDSSLDRQMSPVSTSATGATPTSCWTTMLIPPITNNDTTLMTSTKKKKSAKKTSTMNKAAVSRNARANQQAVADIKNAVASMFH